MCSKSGTLHTLFSKNPFQNLSVTNLKSQARDADIELSQQILNFLADPLIVTNYL